MIRMLPVLVAVAALSLAACGDANVRNDLPRDAGADGRTSNDAGLDAFVEGDAGAEDASDGMAEDAGNTSCDQVACGFFERCFLGQCIRFPPCTGNGTCPDPDDFCRQRHCVPRDLDIDGDGSPPPRDCDETDPDRSLDRTEVCDLIDNDCDGEVDDGNESELCARNPGGGICDRATGSCGCDPGLYDLDPNVPGCECMWTPGIDEGRTCTGAIDLGPLPDTGAVLMPSGNALPTDRDVWYRVLAIDVADSTCDTFSFRARFASNPDNAFELTVFRGNCSGQRPPEEEQIFDLAYDTCAKENGYAEYTWSTRFDPASDPARRGQCPCSNSGPPGPGRNWCTDETKQFFIRVRRRDRDAAPACASYTLEISNGVNP